MKEELKNKNCKIDELEKSSPLNFDDDESPMSDSNYHVLTGMTCEQLYNLCSEIPPSVLGDTNVRTLRIAIARLLVKLHPWTKVFPSPILISLFLHDHISHEICYQVRSF